ncbi:hypothetical protein BX264_4338 [Streptomyces sp. 2333.5]|uniref:DUF6879 family protein n=1 Tax=unclassified Streptomyces TaxID=2593676 RepID=UPI0008954A20|nr:MULTISPECIES: DUF6879 family protein [unclassified Streptomyces]PJJ03936.1 hypothetical protein BX264_4338 [Streptomyces sp. 2333.5]SEE36851.1 hypothetical protein SAMN05428943_4509 [Streptomyces sp. 2314.4]SEE63291.1 hypothetical protein SAMN05428942_4439 [Streptomyces sp. 2112.2]
MLSLGDLGLDASLGEALPLDAYRGDFRERQWTIDGQDSWKLERQQDFKEPGVASWEAFSRGDWEGALRLAEEERDVIREVSEETERRGVTLYRVRVVEEPLTPYLQWEMHFLRLRAEYGEKIRVVGPEQIEALERERPLPELLTLGDQTVYEILYDEQGILDGGVRYLSPEVTARCRDFMRGLYEAGEELSTYFARKVAHLPPPLPK